MKNRAISRPREVLSVDVSFHGVAERRSSRDGPVITVLATNFWGGTLAHVILTLDEARQMLRGLDKEIALAGKKTANRKLTTQQGDTDGDH
jgi:hypothetical protein